MRTFFVFILLCPFLADAQTFSMTGTVASPANVTASGSPLTLTWADNSGNEVGFVVKRSSDGGKTWEIHAYIHWDMTQYVDHVTDAGQYCYRVYAENFSGPSADSNEACIDFVPPTLTAPVLTLFTCCVTTSDPKGKAVLTWTPPQAGVGIRIERRRDALNMPWTAIIGPVASEGTLQDHAVSLSVVWCYRAQFFEGVERSSLSTEVCSQ